VYSLTENPPTFATGSDATSKQPASTVETIVLASSSPRRSELMALTGWNVDVRPASADETPRPGETGRELTRRLARVKAEGGGDLTSVVLAADTTVVDGGDLIEKPADAAMARAMLERLRGRTHTVITSIAVRLPDGTMLVDTCESSVPMRAYRDDEITAYIQRGEPFDKAGGYNIQDAAFAPVQRTSFRDCFANVMGLPLCHVVRTLRKAGIEPPTDVPAACMSHLGYDCPVSSATLGEAA
jgi:MAF protein